MSGLTGAEGGPSQVFSRKYIRPRLSLPVPFYPLAEITVIRIRNGIPFACNVYLVLDEYDVLNIVGMYNLMTMMNCWRLLSLFGAVLFACSAMFGCAGCSPHEGMVVDANTGEPIRDAFVIGQWSQSGYERTICFHLDMTRSDASGKYRIPALPMTDGSWLEDNSLALHAYKKGYRQQWYGTDGKFIDPDKVGVIRLERLKVELVTPEKHIEILREQARQISCRSAGDSKINVAEFYQALYDEALGYTGDRETEDILFLREKVEQYEFGYAGASQRFQAGLRNLKKNEQPQHLPEVRVIEHTDQTARGAIHANE